MGSVNAIGNHCITKLEMKKTTLDEQPIAFCLINPTSTPPNKVKDLILKFFRVLLAHFPAVVEVSACSVLLFWITCGTARRTEA